MLQTEVHGAPHHTRHLLQVPAARAAGAEGLLRGREGDRGNSSIIFDFYNNHLVSPQASDIHNEFMKAIDACNVRFDAAKVILFVLMFALVITLLSAGEPGGHLSE